jgi:hypothetical protein
MAGMTAQAAFQSWLAYAGITAGVVLLIAFVVALFVVALSWSGKRDEQA